MRLIDADALLEALKEKRKFENIPQYLQDEYKDMPEVLLRKTLRVDEINDLITNAPTVQREGWVSVPIDPTDAVNKYNPDDNASFSFAYSANGEGSLYCPECGKAQTIYSGDFDRTIKNKDAICADCQDK